MVSVKCKQQTIFLIFNIGLVAAPAGSVFSHRYLGEICCRFLKPLVNLQLQDQFKWANTSHKNDGLISRDSSLTK